MVARVFRPDISISLTRVLAHSAENDLERIDLLTGHYKQMFESLSLQERKVVAAITRMQQPALTIPEIAKTVRIFQHNHVSSIVGRLVKKGWIEKVSRALYRLSTKDPDLTLFLQLRVAGFPSQLVNQTK